MVDKPEGTGRVEKPSGLSPAHDVAVQIAWARIVARAAVDEQFRRRLTEDPARVFEEFGVKVDANVDLSKDFIPPLDEVIASIERQRTELASSAAAQSSVGAYATALQQAPPTGPSWGYAGYFSAFGQFGPATVASVASACNFAPRGAALASCWSNAPAYSSTIGAGPYTGSGGYSAMDPWYGMAVRVGPCNATSPGGTASAATGVAATIGQSATASPFSSMPLSGAPSMGASVGTSGGYYRSTPIGGTGPAEAEHGWGPFFTHSSSWGCDMRCPCGCGTRGGV